MTKTTKPKPNDEHSEDKPNIFKRIWGFRKLIIIEPILVFWILPAAFNTVGILNLGLEKACRVNLQIDKYVCENMLNKALNNIDCESLPEEDVANNTILAISEFNNTTMEIIMNATGYDSIENYTFPNASMLEMDTKMDLNKTVCKAERETQKVVSFVSGIRGPISSVFPIIVILFAGGWSDRKGIRKPCMYFPMIGEVLASAALIITAVFMDELPMEFGHILEKVLPAMFGGSTLLIMGIYSYLTAITEEKDRTFRFGIFAIVGQIVPIVGSPFGGKLYKNLGYVRLFILSLCLQLAGVLYIIFFIKEVESKPKVEADQNKSAKEAKESGGHENLAIELHEIELPSNSESSVRKRENKPENKTEPTNGVKIPEEHKEDHLEPEKITKPKNCLLDFFDPTSAYDCIKVYTKKRDGNKRLFLLLLTIAYTLFLGPALGEIDYYYQFVLIALNWDEDQYSYYSTYSFAIVIVGTFLMTAILSKAFKVSDSMVGLLASICTIISRPMFAFSKESILYYAACTVDMFVSIKALTIKAIISSFVETEEIGRLYSVLGITDALGGFIFPPIYSQIYSSTIDTFPGAFYLFGEIFFVPNAILFAITYVFLPKTKPEEEDEDKKKEDIEGNNNTGREEVESTYM